MGKENPVSQVTQGSNFPFYVWELHPAWKGVGGKVGQKHPEVQTSKYKKKKDIRV